MRSVDLDVENLAVSTPNDIKLNLAALGKDRNLALTGKVGPLITNGAIDLSAIPLAFDLDTGPLTIDQLKAVPQIATAAAPAQAHQPGHGHGQGQRHSEALAFNLATDLTGNQVVYTGVLDKAAGVPLKLTAAGTRKDVGGSAQVEVQSATLVLGDLNLKAGQIQLGQNLSARLDSNRFDLASMGKMLVALSKYNASGKAEIHATVKMIQKQPEVDGVVTLASVTVTPPGKRCNGERTERRHQDGGQERHGRPARVQPGIGHARLTVNAQSIQPINANYDFSADV